MLQVRMPEAFKIVYEDVPVPEVTNNGVLIEMQRIGVCGSDVQVYHGRHKYMKFPVVQGHEGSGIVAKVGSKVTNFRPGDRVTVQPQVFCGECYPCKTGHYNVCQNLKVYGVHTNGMAVEYFLTEESKVLKLTDTISFDEGAVVEPVAVAVGAIRRAGDLVGKNVVVMGAGPIGNLVAQIANISGAARVMITDVNQKRLELAKKCGVDYAVNTMGIDFGETIKKHFGLQEADIIIDCAAIKASITQAIRNSRCASKIVVVGNFKEPIEIELPMLQRREVDMLSIMMYLRVDFVRAINLIADGKLHIHELISDYFDIRDFDKVYAYMDAHANDIMKVMIKVKD